jgi:hypothetical protein
MWAHGWQALAADASSDAIHGSLVVAKDSWIGSMQQCKGFVGEVVGCWLECFAAFRPWVVGRRVNLIVSIVVECCRAPMAGVVVELVIAAWDPLLCDEFNELIVQGVSVEVGDDTACASGF